MSQEASPRVMSVKVDVHADERAGPGWANLRVSGLRASFSQAASDLATELQFSLQRNQDNRYLAERGDWSPSEVWHRAQSVSETDNTLTLRIGPDLVDELLADPRAVYRIHLRLGAQAWAGVMRMARGVYPSGAAGHVPDASRQVQAPALIPVDLPEQTEQMVALDGAVAEPAPARFASTSDKPSQRHKILIASLLILLLAFIAGVIWYLLSQRQVVQPSGTQTGSEAAAQPCSLQAMQAATDDLLFLQSCVQTRPDTKAVMAVIVAGKQAGRCDLIQRLYAHQAQAGSVELAVAYAREFDPQTFAGGCFKEPDPATAIYWYDTALKLEPGRDEVAARIKALEAIK